MKPLLLVISSIFLFSSVAKAQLPSEEMPLIESLNDSTDISENFYNIVDSLSLPSYPASDLYTNWNTRSIYYKPDDDCEIIFDSIPIILHDSSAGICYNHPFLGPITSHYGYRRSRFHTGVDVDLETGDSVLAAMDGMVRFATYDGGYGKVVVIRHDNGLESLYSHLSKIYVDTNQMVRAGDCVGLGGATGRATGSHLHYELRYLGKTFDPESMIDFETGMPIADTAYLCDASTNYMKRIVHDKNATFHYVSSGDTLSAIGRKYGTTVSKLCYYNGIRDTAILQIGQKIRVR
jgi:hypothetical protein